MSSTQPPVSNTSVTQPVAPFFRRPLNTPFKQQLLPSLQPAFRPQFFIAWFTALGILFIALGAAIVVDSDNIESIEVRYDAMKPCSWEEQRYRPGWGCEALYVNFTVSKTMKAPVFLYYKLTEVHQNNRRFVRSVSNTQLSGQVTYSAAERNDCQPFNSPSDFVDFSTTPTSQLFVPPLNVNSTSHRDIQAAIYHPCGLVPWSMFNDSIALMSVKADGSRELICDGDAFDVLSNPTNLVNGANCEKRGIAWSTVAGVIYNPVPDIASNPMLLTHRGWTEACDMFLQDPSMAEFDNSNWYIYVCNGWYLGEPGHKIPNPIDEDLWVWNRIASYSTFKKLYRRIIVDIPPGQYTMRIVQRWNAASFGGTKSFVLETLGWMGNKNYFLGGLFLAVGSLAFVFAIVCTAVHVMQPPRAIG